MQNAPAPPSAALLLTESPPPCSPPAQTNCVAHGRHTGWGCRIQQMQQGHAKRGTHDTKMMCLSSSSLPVANSASPSVAAGFLLPAPVLSSAAGSCWQTLAGASQATASCSPVHPRRRCPGAEDKVQHQSMQAAQPCAGCVQPCLTSSSGGSAMFS
jgi:hypothetical protein